MKEFILFPCKMHPHQLEFHGKLAQTADESFDSSCLRGLDEQIEQKSPKQTIVCSTS